MSPDKLSLNIISQYWNDFRAGSTWNLYLSTLQYQKTDSWASVEDWILNAEKCIESSMNITQALEILLVENYDAHVRMAECVVKEWGEQGRHDPHYYYDILALLPKENKIRKAELSNSNFLRFTSDDGWGFSIAARKALIRACDNEFLDFISEYINEKLLSKNTSNEQLEEHLIPLIVDLGKGWMDYVKPEGADRLKAFCLNYLERDKQVVNQYLNGRENFDGEREIWIGDNIAHYAYIFGWQDIVEDLKSMDWYWLSVFGDWWDDYENDNLLSWSLMHSDNLLKQRAIYVMELNESKSIDGAIAWERISRQSEKN